MVGPVLDLVHQKLSFVGVFSEVFTRRSLVERFGRLSHIFAIVSGSKNLKWDAYLIAGGSQVKVGTTRFLCTEAQVTSRVGLREGSPLTPATGVCSAVLSLRSFALKVLDGSAC